MNKSVDQLLESNPVFSGNIKKQGTMKTWAKRFAIVTETAIYFFKTQSSTEPADIILIESISKKSLRITNESKNIFSLQSIGQLHLFTADSQKELYNWIDAIERASKHKIVLSTAHRKKTTDGSTNPKSSSSKRTASSAIPGPTIKKQFPPSPSASKISNNIVSDNNNNNDADGEEEGSRFAVPSKTSAPTGESNLSKKPSSSSNLANSVAGSVAGVFKALTSGRKSTNGKGGGNTQQSLKGTPSDQSETVCCEFCNTEVPWDKWCKICGSDLPLPLLQKCDLCGVALIAGTRHVCPETGKVVPLSKRNPTPSRLRHQTPELPDLSDMTTGSDFTHSIGPDGSSSTDPFDSSLSTNPPRPLDQKSKNTTSSGSKSKQASDIRTVGTRSIYSGYSGSDIRSISSAGSVKDIRKAISMSFNVSDPKVLSRWANSSSNLDSGVGAGKGKKGKGTAGGSKRGGSKKGADGDDDLPEFFGKAKAKSDTVSQSVKGKAFSYVVGSGAVTGPRYYCIEARTDCARCSHPVVINGIIRVAQCSNCLLPIAIPKLMWLTLIETMEEDWNELDQEQGRNLQLNIGEREYRVMYGKQAPKCTTCRTPLPVDKKSMRPGKSTAPACETCADPITTFPSPKWLTRAIPSCLQLYAAKSRDIDDGPIPQPDHPKLAEAWQDLSKEITIPCTNCSHGLRTTRKTARKKVCKNCGTSNEIPSDVWRIHHPLPQTKRWYLLCKGDLIAPRT